ncbi:MAG: acyl--CoA ligase [Deltaproteobacteria bacterium]|nr:acyl--CoA ligase [Deltaproteobacteria bacterium]
MGGYDWGLFDWNMLKRAQQMGAPVCDMVYWDYVKRNAELWGDKEAVVDTFLGFEKDKRRRKTWKEVYDDCNTIIFNLANLGLRKEHMVITQLPNVIENYYATIFTSKLSLIYACNQVELGEKDVRETLEVLNPDVTIIVPSYRDRQLAKWHLDYQKNHSNLKYIFVVHRPDEAVPEGTRSFTELLNPAIREIWDDTDLRFFKTDPFDPHLIVPSGGTTGAPKACLAAIGTFFPTVHDWYSKIGLSAYDSGLVFGPLNGGTGRCMGVWSPIMAGSRSIFLAEFNEENACKMTEEEDVTKWLANPALMIRAISSPFFDQYDLSSLKSLSYAGAPLPPEIGEKVWGKGIHVSGAYGSMSVPSAGMISIAENDKEICLNFSCDPPIGDEYIIVDAQGNELPPSEVGEIWIWAMHHGFYNDPDLTTESYDEQGYQHTGDLGIKNEKGNIKIVGRSTDMILRGGQNVFPKEVEDVLGKHPKIREIAVVPMPDKLLGEKACAYVVPMKGEKITLKDLTVYLGEHDVTKYKWPERLEIIDEMPVSTGGKIMKEPLKKDIADKLKKEGFV